MKRILASLLAAGFLLTSFVPAVIADDGDAGALETKALINYADKTAEDDAQQVMHTGSSTAGYAVSFMSSVRGGAGASLKLTSSSGDPFYGNFAMQTIAGRDITGMEAIELYIKKVDGGDEWKGSPVDNGIYRFVIADGEYESFRMKPGTEISYIVKGDGAIQKTTVAANYDIQLPSGFEGVIRLPVADVVYGFGGSGNKELDLDAINSIALYTRVSADTYVAVDEVRGLSDIEYIDPSLLPPEPADSVILASYADKTTADDADEAVHIGGQTTGTVEYIPSVRGGEGVSLKLMAAGSGSTLTWANFALKPTVGQDVTGMEAVELYIKKVPGEGTDSGAYRFSLADGDGEYFRLEDGKALYYIAKGDGTLQKAVVANKTVHLPTGFEGVVRLPLADLIYDWGGNGDKQLDVDDIFNIQIAVDVNQDTYLAVDEVRGIRDAEALDPSLGGGGEDEEALKVLFVGNSATYVNDMPKMFERLCQEAGHDVTVRSLTVDGAFLSQFADPDQNAGKALRTELGNGYDIVFLQDNTQCIGSEERRAASKAAVKTIDELVKEAGGETYLYVRPPVSYNNAGYTPLQQVEEYTKLFDEVGKEIGAPRAYANEAFAYMMENYPDIEIWGADDAHPNEQGSFLVACVCFATLFDESPADVYDGGFDADVAQAIWEAADAAASGSGSQPGTDPGPGADTDPDKPSAQQRVVLADYGDKAPSGDASEALQTDSQGKASYIPSIRGGEGASLKLVAARDEMTWNASSLKPVTNYDATNGGTIKPEAIELYIRKVAADAESDNGAYRFAIGEAGGTSHWEIFRLKKDAKVYYMEKDGTTLKEALVLEDGSCVLPSGFEGVVRLPLDQLEYWYGGTAGGNRQLNLDNLFNIIITTDVNASSQYLVVDEVSAITNMMYTGDDVSTEDPVPGGNPGTGVVSYVNIAVLAMAASGVALVGFKRRKK
ncbi:MAG TPA: hypothetical protein H9684_07785 [Firmicutes bacterium]|nr:hypothetical protein [Bacillota bacterium]